MHILRSFSDEATSRFLQKSKKSVDSTYTLLLIFVNTEENHDTNTKTWIRWLLKKKKTITATSLLFVIWSRFYFTARKQAKKLHFVCWCITLSVLSPIHTIHTTTLLPYNIKKKKLMNHIGNKTVYLANFYFIHKVAMSTPFHASVEEKPCSKSKHTCHNTIMKLLTIKTVSRQ